MNTTQLKLLLNHDYAYKSNNYEEVCAENKKFEIRKQRITLGGHTRVHELISKNHVKISSSTLFLGIGFESHTRKKLRSFFLWAIMHVTLPQTLHRLKKWHLKTYVH